MIAFDVLSEYTVTEIRLSHGMYHKKAWPVVIQGGIFLDMSYFWVASLRG